MIAPTHEPTLTIDEGRLVWLFPDGKKLPWVGGGSDGGLGDPGSITLSEPPAPGNPGNLNPPGPPPAAPPTGYLTEEEVRERLNRARTEEREKLYGQRAQEMAELEQLRHWRAEQERLRLEEEARQADTEAETKRRKEQEELDAKSLIEVREAELRAEMDSQRRYFDEEIQRRDALLAKEREYAELMTYRERVVAANQENILPELVAYIGGNSQAEIDQAVQDAIERTQSVLSNFRAVGQEQQRQAPGVSTRAPAVGPESMVGGQRTFSAEDIQGWSMQDYMKYRSQLPPGRASQSDRGLF